ncbi:MAG: biopolymer transporter ExbD [Candidatus Infernicultor aquiphilus]|uniref:Biopolymer transporter ExbD n=1 Tax=Candidatus Infernicultor aquiphilus TaxID=1805029 RepID=A0A1J5GB70_9BACT|nr:biopolymer transporter ExbD [bacterium]OIP69507.1 MAG: biopolymer transporter ExbD [Candidatus Atribacteria bacterium CG2_30_33_13]PIU25491.1 MAG: biopolymer transporter ExbD [Candidatus Atribacteria bacterium CG08_land_8_20_14_0_20_33_29]PIW11717.1 MAG: biopolymer transporter ExbD [Candidatus Atribacteria bacterium CG17_big_fil_post_rev_8_21_14_2_50_34_11]PIX34378.1 MAG: biopolymer transporter ExbD [Candidatus Atribacteria bacterium CG_4_8_14_3_um_filter_34_18]PIY32348.1 MAG: biopolymer tr
MKFHHPNKKSASFDLTPLIDIVFQLLIFFMVTTTFVNLENRVKINLPSGDFAAVEPSKNITVTITEDNTIYLNGKLIDPLKITESIATELKKEPEKIVVLEADKNVLHGKVISVMDLLKKGGADKIAIATQPTKKK